MHTHRCLLRLAAAGAAALLAAAPPAHAQGEAELPTTRLPGWSVTPSLAVGALFDSNVAVSSPRFHLGETQGDTLFSLAPAGELQFLGRRSDFSASYQGFLRRHMDVRGLDGFNQRAAANFKRLLTRRVTIFASNRFGDSPTTDEVEVNGVPFRRLGSRTNTFGAGGTVRLARFTTLSSRYDATWVDFDRDEAEALVGGWIHGVRTDVSQQVTARISLGGEHSYRTASLDEGRREFGFQDFGGVARIQLGRHTTGSVAAGLGTLQDRSAGTTRHGPYLRLATAHETAHLTMGASFERQFLPSFGFGGSSRSQELRTYVLAPIARRAFVRSSVAWRRSVPLQETSIEADTIWIRSTVGYLATRWARVEGFYTYTHQDAIGTGGEVDRHRLGTQVVISQPVRIP